MSSLERILIAYDGSDDARYAIEQAAKKVRARRAVVVYARTPLESVAAHLDGHPEIETAGLDPKYVEDAPSAWHPRARISLVRPASTRPARSSPARRIPPMRSWRPPTSSTRR
jgi:hypothetical protein